MTRILAIETSCDETSAAVVEKNSGIARVLSNIVASQVKLHAKTGGVVPEVAAREHIKPIIPIIRLALEHAKITLKDIDAIAVTHGPGLHTALSVGVETGKALSFATGKPLIPVNHLLGHIAANWNGREPVFPSLCLVVSGGHTELALLKNTHAIQLLGQTRDDAAGEAFDKVAQLLKLSYPGGPIISTLAEHGDADAFELPRPMIDANTLDFSFSGLKTAVRYIVDGDRSIVESTQRTSDLCASFQAAVVDVLVTKTINAARKFKPREILLAGGVAANHELRRRLAGEIKKLPWKPKYRQPPLDLCTDNAGMIGLAAAYFPHTTTQPTWKTVDIQPTLSV